jgi:hypothetical protein
MYKITKYINESSRIILNIIGIIIIVVIMFFICNYFINSIEKPQTLQAIVIKKYSKEDITLFHQHSLDNSKIFHVVIKDEQKNIKDLKVSELDYNLMKEKTEYVFRLSKNKLLFVLTSTQDEFLASNKVDKIKIDINNNDTEIAIAYANNEVIKPISTDKPIVSQNVTNKPTITPSATDKPTVTPNATDKPTVTPNATDKPIVSPNATDKPIVSPSVTDKPITNSDLVNKDYNIRQEFVFAKEVYISSKNTINYDSTITIENKEYGCSNIPNNLGSCIKDNKSTTWKLVQASKKTLTIYSKDSKFEDYSVSQK